MSVQLVEPIEPLFVEIEARLEKMMQNLLTAQEHVAGRLLNERDRRWLASAQRDAEEIMTRVKRVRDSRSPLVRFYDQVTGIYLDLPLSTAWNLLTAQHKELRERLSGPTENRFIAPQGLGDSKT